MNRPVLRPALTVALVAIVLVVCGAPGSAHKPITSPFTYNQDVLPILRDRCGRCHVSGGVAPMSLLTHADAVPWGESIRTEVLAGHMPPGGVDEAPARFRNAGGLSPREMNLLLTWVTGGTPLGDAAQTPASATRERVWPLGTPDLTLPLPSEIVVAADVRERTSELVIPTGVTERRWLRAVDLSPGNAAIVRAATIAVRSPAASGTGASIERTLALWLPGDEPAVLDDQVGFELPAGAELVVRVLYRKTWQFERQEVRDRSVIGLYFGAASATAVQALRLANDSAPPARGRALLSSTLAEDARLLAIYPDTGIDDVAVKVVATRPDGTRLDLIAFHPRPGWLRRYWFREPVTLPRGTTIEVTSTVDNERRWLPLSLAPPPSPVDPELSRIGLTLNVVRKF